MQYKSKGEDKNSHYTGVFCSRVARRWLVCMTQDRAYPAIISLEPGHHILGHSTQTWGQCYTIVTSALGTAPALQNCHAVSSVISAHHSCIGQGFLDSCLSPCTDTVGNAAANSPPALQPTRHPAQTGFFATQSSFGTGFPFTPLIQAFPKATFPPLCRHTFFMQELYHLSMDFLRAPL